MQLLRRPEVIQHIYPNKRENPSPCLSRINDCLCLRPKVQKNGHSNQRVKGRKFRDEATGAQQ